MGCVICCIYWTHWRDLDLLDFAGTRVYPGWLFRHIWAVYTIKLRQRSTIESSHLSRNMSARFSRCCALPGLLTALVIFRPTLLCCNANVSLGNNSHRAGDWQYGLVAATCSFAVRGAFDH